MSPPHPTPATGTGALQTEFEFTLPQGYVDGDGSVHREGRMRLATAGDEILPMRDPRVRANDSYLTVILLSRVLTALGTVDEVTPNVVEHLFVADLSYLQDLYERVNVRGADVADASCPECGETFEVTVGDPSAPTGTEPEPEPASAHAHGTDLVASDGGARATPGPGETLGNASPGEAAGPEQRPDPES